MENLFDLHDLRELMAREILGEINAVKLRSSMTLFACATQSPSPRKVAYTTNSRGLDEGIEVFKQVLGRYFGGELDGATLELIG